MKAALIVYLSLSATHFLSVSAAAMNCHRAATAAEHAICGNAELRQADILLSSNYAKVRQGIISKPLAMRLIESQRAWVLQRDKSCQTAACLEPIIAVRNEILEALAAQVSEPNPTLFNLHAVWLEGKWKAGIPEPKTLNSFANLPEQGVVTLKVGALCDATGHCDDFGLSYEKAGTDAADRHGLTPAELPPGAPIYPVLLNGKAEYELAALADGTLLALSRGCPPGKGPCGDIRQVWQPLGRDSKLHEVDLGRE